MEDVFVLSAVRTPIGAFNGALKNFSTVQLGKAAIEAGIEKANIKASDVDEVYMGSVLQANLGQNPARQAMLAAGVPDNVPATTVNKVCASGMKAISLGAMQIMTGQADVAVCGGMESMTNVPYYLPNARFGYKYGDGAVVCGLSRDALSDFGANDAMGVCAEECADDYKVTREEQDAYCLRSYDRALAAQKNGDFKEEIVPVKYTFRGKEFVISEDEEPGKLMREKVTSLRSPFRKDGTVTAANASSISDGAAAVVLCSGKKLKELKLTPIAKILSFADGATTPRKFTEAPAIAIPKALAIAKLDVEKIDIFEINEAFSVVSIINARKLNIPDDKINLNGGAVSIGHPVGCSGARIVVTLLNALKKREKKLGCAGICNGGGGAGAMVFERL